MDALHRAGRHLKQVPTAKSLTRKTALLALALGYIGAAAIADAARTRAGRFLAFTAAVLALVAAIVAVAVAVAAVYAAGG